MVLGTAQDGGMPHASCRCTRCDAARREPARRRLVASLAVCTGPTDCYLIDATPDLREQLDRLPAQRPSPPTGVDRAPLKGVFLTHAHIGHYVGLAFFGYEAVHTRGLPLYCTERMAGFLRENGPWDQLVRIGNVELRVVAPGFGVDLGPALKLTAFPVPHRDEYTDTVAYRIDGPRQSLLYVPDTDRWESWDPSLPESLQAVDVALLDGTFYSRDELPGREVAEIGHPLIGATMDLLERRVADGSLRVLFTHLNHSNPAVAPDSAARREVERRGFEIATEGQRIPL